MRVATFGAAFLMCAVLVACISDPEPPVAHPPVEPQAESYTIVQLKQWADVAANVAPRYVREISTGRARDGVFIGVGKGHVDDGIAWASELMPRDAFEVRYVRIPESEWLSGG